MVVVPVNRIQLLFSDNLEDFCFVHKRNDRRSSGCRTLHLIYLHLILHVFLYSYHDQN